MKNKREQLVATLLDGGIAVIRTDTLYGIVARAEDEQAAEKVYRAKGRNAHKSCIVLIDNTSQAFGDMATANHDYVVPTSILLDAPRAPAWLKRENNMIAPRIPQVEWLRDVLRRTGPLVAPSANPEGLPPAMTVAAAKRYFGAQVDIYVDDGEVPADTPPSQLIRISADGSIERLR